MYICNLKHFQLIFVTFASLIVYVFVINTFNYFLILFIYFLSSGNYMIGLVFWRNYFLIVQVLLFQQKTLIKAFYIASLKNVPFVCCILKIFYFSLALFGIIHLFTKINKFLKYNLPKIDMQSGVDQGKIWCIFRVPSQKSI